MRYAVVLITIGLTVYALIDCARTDSAEIKAMPKALWLAVIIVLSPIGPVAWLLAGRDRGSAQPARPRRAGPIAPDDDPVFLRQLDLERRRRAELDRLEAEQREAGRPDPPQDDDGTAGVR